MPLVLAHVPRSLKDFIFYCCTAWDLSVHLRNKELAGGGAQEALP